MSSMERGDARVAALAVPSSPFDPSAPWSVHPQVAVRPEAFGALLYHYESRRLSFVKDRRLAEVVRRLAASPSAAWACREAGIPDSERSTYFAALARLAASGLLVRGRRQARSGAPETVVDSAQPSRPRPLVEQFELGLAAPICLTWELTYACNLACVHCLSSAGRRDPHEFSAEEARRVVDELAELKVFYVNIGGGEPTLRADFLDLLEYSTSRGVGVKFSTNGSRVTPAFARRIAAMDYVDVQVSLDGATDAVNDALRGEGSFVAALRALGHLADAGVGGLKVSVVVTRRNVEQLDELRALADRFGAQLRLTRLRPSGRGADVWEDLHLLPEQQRRLYDWLVGAGEDVLTGDSFFHLSAFGSKLPGLNLCGAGRVVCLIDPVGDVYACPFAIHERFRAGNVRDPGGFPKVWVDSTVFSELRAPEHAGGCQACAWSTACRGGCMAAKFGSSGIDVGAGKEPVSVDAA